MWSAIVAHSPRYKTSPESIGNNNNNNNSNNNNNNNNNFNNNNNNNNNKIYVYIHETKIYKKIPVDIPIEKALKKYAVTTLEENHVTSPVKWLERFWSNAPKYV